MARATTGPNLARLQNVSLAVGVVALAGALLLTLLGGGPFFESYLYSFLYWLGLSLGCLVLLLVVHLAGGSWGAMIRRPLEAGVSVLPVMAVLFVPLLFGLGALYPWTDAEYLATHPTVDATTSYLNVPAFVIRSVIYFAIWIAGAVIFLRQSRRQDEDAARSGTIAFQLKRTSGAWIVAYVLTMTFAGFDWGMSLTPAWFSGIYSVILMAGQAINAMAFIIVVVVLLAGSVPAIDALLTEKRLQDLGNFLMAFLMFWAYVSISQLIIIWSNNTVETSSYYVARLGEGWVYVAAFLTFVGFFAPFMILFSRWVKRKRTALAVVALFAILVRFVDLFWIIVPSFDRVNPVHLLDILLVVGMGGLWLAVFARSLASRPLLPVNDPRLAPAPVKVAEHHA